MNESATSPLASEEIFVPREPTTIEETGLGVGFLSDLALKLLYFRGYVTGGDIAKEMCLPFSGVVDRILEFLKREMLIEIKGAGGLGQATYRYVITGKGIDRAREILDRGQYVGPAPVTLQQYNDGIRNQPMLTSSIHEDTMRDAVSHLVINDSMLERLGPAVNSGRSIFLYGDPGNGKTVIAESFGRVVLGAEMYIPYAIEVGGMVIKVYDPVNHRLAPEPEEEPADNRGPIRPRHDRRWIRINRPVITTGGELTLETLDLVWDSLAKYYEAPFQMKSNGGMFLIDDFGRQQVRPRDLLNRWVVPLEKRWDFLTLHTGQKIEIPFEVLIVFSTNLEPRDLVDEAFLRRIRHKIEIDDPTYEDFREIFRRECANRNIPYDDEALGYLLREQYIKPGNPVRACHPRDLLDEIVDIAAYRGVPPTLSRDLIDRARKAYFVDL
ncbi:MAG TPA: ATP-binding protein [Anaerolineae bacterium]|nr:ATP-binding protein [Anaerolineae bacterium]